MSFRNWIGLKSKFDYSIARPLGKAIGFITFFIVFMLTLSAILTLLSFFKANLGLPPYDKDLDGTALRNIGLVLAALIGAPFIVWRTIIAAKQVSVAEESLYNDKIDIAAKGLSSRYQRTVREPGDNGMNYSSIWEDDQVTRATSVDQLDGLIRERPELAPRLVNLIASYIRGTFPSEDLNLTEPFQTSVPRMDLQRSVDAIGKLLPIAREIDGSEWRLDLRMTNFDGVSFKKGYFYAVDFSRSRFEGCNMEDADLRGADFSGSLLNYAWFRGAKLTGAKLDFCILNRPYPTAGAMNFSINLADDITGISFASSDISALDYLGEPDIISRTFGTIDTIVSDEISATMPSIDEWRLAIHAERSNSPNIIRAFEQVKEKGFHSWSPYQTNDIGSGHLRAKLMNHLRLNKWPYV